MDLLHLLNVHEKIIKQVNVNNFERDFRSLRPIQTFSNIDQEKSMGMNHVHVTKTKDFLKIFYTVDFFVF